MTDARLVFFGGLFFFWHRPGPGAINCSTYLSVRSKCEPNQPQPDMVVTVRHHAPSATNITAGWHDILVLGCFCVVSSNYGTVLSISNLTFILHSSSLVRSNSQSASAPSRHFSQNDKGKVDLIRFFRSSLSGPHCLPLLVACRDPWQVKYVLIIIDYLFVPRYGTEC